MSEEPEKLAEGTLISHLLELRSRLIRALAAVGLFFIPCAYYSNQIFTFIAKPLLDKLPKGGTLIATGVMTPFTTPFKLSFFVALFIAMPYVLYQVWAFVGPGLYRREKRFAVPLMVSSIVLFYAGVIFAYVVVFPMIFAFFTSTTPQGRLDDDGHHELHGLRAHDVPRLRRRLRSAGRGGAPGADGNRAAREAEGEPRLRAHRDLHHRRDSHAARCALAMRHGACRCTCSTRAAS